MKNGEALVGMKRRGSQLLLGELESGCYQLENSVEDFKGLALARLVLPPETEHGG